MKSARACRRRTTAAATSDRSGAIRIRGARENNLRDVHVEIPRGQLTVVTGVSGSGKSSLAFDTVHAEGQRRYLAGLAPRLRRLLGRRTRPDVDGIDGLPPTLAISQLTTPPGPRSTVGTLAEIHDLLRLLLARAGTVHCPDCGAPTARTEPPRMVEAVLGHPEGSRFLVLAPLVGKDRLGRARREGFVRIRTADGVRLLEEIPEEPPVSDAIGVVVDRLVVGPTVRGRLQDSVETALRVGDGRVAISFVGDDVPEDLEFSEDHRCAACGVRVETPVPSTFSFNGPRGACPACTGLGERTAIDPTLLFPDPEQSLSEAADDLTERLPPSDARELSRTLRAFARGEEIPLATRLRDLDEETRRSFLEDEALPWLEARKARARAGPARRRYESITRRDPCPECAGSRLGPDARSVRLGGRTIVDLTALSLPDLLRALETIELPPALAAVADPILDEARSRLRILLRLGLGHLALERGGRTLSGGELQRIRLGSRLGAELVGVLYVLDEPTVGLHPRDTEVLLEALVDLRDRGNTLLLVEHEPAVIRAADHLVEIGPGAGRAGGAVTAAGPRDEVLASDALTARALRDVSVSSRDGPRTDPRRGSWIRLEGATEHNLRDLDARFPLGALTAVTGVSGAGKSTLARDVLLRALRARLHADPARPGSFRRLTGDHSLAAAVEISPALVVRSPRSVPATAVGLFAPVRRLFAETPEARMRGYGPQRFSFNRKGGRCAACDGLGERTVAMEFLPDVRVRCDLCEGRRYDPETLEVRFRGLTIAEMLALSVDDALPVFRGFPKVEAPLAALARVGLGYLLLGQPGRTLSGGESQRLRLAVELARPATGPTLYLLDEPSAGLHPLDVARLLGVLHALVARGHTIVVVEHDLGIVAAADWILDLGPGAGPAGGELVAEGTPGQIASDPKSMTGRYLRASGLPRSSG